MKYTFLLLFLPLLFFTCTPKQPTTASLPVLDPNEPFSYEPYVVDNVRRPEDFTFKRSSMEPDHYQPDTIGGRYLPARYVMLNLHIMNTTDTFYRFFGEEAQEYLLQVMDHTSNLMKKTPPIWLQPDSMNVPALPRNMGFQLSRKENGDLGIYEHYDDELYWYLHKGKERNRADRAVINKYAIDKDSVLNIFIMGPPREKVEEGYKLTGTDGIFLGDAIKITGMLSRNAPPWDFDGLIAHEIAHAFGLYHGWTRNDGCDDTPVHKNDAWSRAKEDTGPGKSSNNLMDYSNRQESLTPCQIGRMHARMSDITARYRKWLVPAWCRYRPNVPVRVTTELNLLGARDYNTDIYVKRGGKLKINSRVHLPEGAAIHVDPGGELVIGPEAIIHSDCGGLWDGILIGVTESGISGAVYIDPMATFLNEKL